MRRRLLRDAALSLALLAAPVTVRAQSAISYGSLGNFDISNDTGQICHGFEIEIGGGDARRRAGRVLCSTLRRSEYRALRGRHERALCEPV